jgi:hypothetical protein
MEATWAAARGEGVGEVAGLSLTMCLVTSGLLLQGGGAPRLLLLALLSSNRFTGGDRCRWVGLCLRPLLLLLRTLLEVGRQL